jgi:hypothetical protein
VNGLGCTMTTDTPAGLLHRRHGLVAFSDVVDGPRSKLDLERLRGLLGDLKPVLPIPPAWIPE